MTVRTRLLLAQAPLGAGLLLLAAVAVSTVGALGRASQEILKDNFRSVLAVERMEEAALRRDAPAFEAELRAQEGNITEPGEAEATAALRRAWEAYRPGMEAARSVDEAAWQALHAAADRVQQMNQDAILVKSDRARALAERNRALLLYAALAALGLAAVASGWLTKRALRPLNALSMAVRRIGEGDLEARARLSGDDEIAQVGREFDTMADRLREYRSSSLGELLQAQQASQAAIDSLPDPVLVLSTAGEVLNVNHAAERLLPAGETLASLPPPLREAVEKVRAHVASGKGPFAPRGLEDAIRLEDGALLPRAAPLHGEHGEVTGVTLVLQDVTRLLRFDELKNDLVATVAHEFRTPLTSLRMAVHILVEGTVGALSEKQLDLLFAARDDCERLHGIVEDLLDLSRIQAGGVPVSLGEVPAATLLEAAATRNGEAGRKAGGRIDVDGTDLVRPVFADAERIALVFDNLVQNAFRHGPPGAPVRLSAAEEGEWIRFAVEDEGPGIPTEHQQRVFEKFYRLPGAKGEGIGLGLYISREIVLAHGGAMGVEGARFWFTLPLAPSPVAPGPSP